MLVCSWEVAGVTLGEVRWVEECAVHAGPRAPPSEGGRGGCRVGKVRERRVAGGRGGDCRGEGEETCWVSRGGGEKRMRRGREEDEEEERKGCRCERNKVGNCIVGLGRERYLEKQVLCMKRMKGGLT